MRARRAARRHREELGEVLEVFADPPGLLTRLGFALAWVVFSALTLVRPGDSAVLAIAPTIAFALIFTAIYVALSGERLVVCQGGLLIGSVAPGMRQYILVWKSIVPGSVAPVTGARRYGRERKVGGSAQSTLRRTWWTSRGVHLVGPSAQDARRHRAVLASFQDAPPSSMDGRWIWFAGTGRTDPHRATQSIARAAHSAGFEALAAATAAAGVRELSGDPADASRHLPGAP